MAELAVRKEVEVIAAGQNTPQEWADYCRQRERDSVQATIEWCRAVYDAKQNLSISFRGWADEYYREYSYSTLHKLAKTGASLDRLCSIATQRNVANDWTTLYLITTVTDK